VIGGMISGILPYVNWDFTDGKGFRGLPKKILNAGCVGRTNIGIISMKEINIDKIVDALTDALTEAIYKFYTEGVPIKKRKNPVKENIKRIVDDITDKELDKILASDSSSPHTKLKKDPVKEIEKLIKTRKGFFDSDGEMSDEKKIDEYAAKINELLKKHIDELDPEFILEAVTHLGCWPQLIYDDDGHWAVSEEGISNVIDVTKDTYQQTTTVSDTNSWKGNIRDAVKYYILHYEED